MMDLMLVASFTLLAGMEGAAPNKARPNFIYIFADDLGYRDIGIRNPAVVTPVIDRLATEGVLLTNNYVQPICSPSRFSFMTGRYPHKQGMQHSVFRPGQNFCSPLQNKFLPQYLKELGYTTHAVGKWHLGHCRWECTPTYRGFDTFYGGYAGGANYWTHTIGKYYDWHNETKVDTSVAGTHSQDLVQDRSLEILDNMDDETPFFLYMAFHNPHSPMLAKQEFLQLYDNMDATDTRRNYLGLVSGMDHAIGLVVDKLEEKGLKDNTFVIYVADNGGDVNEGDNFPLRGAKATVWEGGTKSLSFVWSPLLENAGYENDGLMHVTDWFPTIISLAGGTPPPKKEIDGKDQSKMLIQNGPSKRNKMVYQFNREHEDGRVPQYGEIAVRNKWYKLIWGFPGQNDGYGFDDVDFVPNLPFYRDAVLGTASDRKKRGGPYVFDSEDTYILQTYIDMVKVTDENIRDGTGHLQLFNLKVDPTETTNLADSSDTEDQNALEELIEMVRQEIAHGFQPVTAASQSFTENPYPNGNVYPGYCNDTVPLP